MLSVCCVILGTICVLLGFIGCVVPAIPGPLLSFVSLLCLLPTENSVSSTWLIVGAVIMVGASALDYIVPALSAKKFKCSRSGIWGCTIGSIIGMFVMPIGLFIGPFIGAVIGELLAGKLNASALKGGFGALIGVIIGMIIKMVACGVIAAIFAIAAVKSF